MVIIKADVIISGWNGKMGHVLRTLLPQHFSGQIINANDLNLYQLTSPKVWIDFSHVTVFEKWIERVVQLKCPLVIGTTGLSDIQLKKLKALSVKIPVLYDVNFSEGIHVLRQLIKNLPNVSAFDLHILEAHHKTKVDKPSGTAKILMKDLGKEVPILSIRAGGIRGEHSVVLSGNNEQIVLKHEVWDRSVFAEGAIKAAKWLLQQPCGFFNFDSILLP